jgi:hypothetical protein
MMHFRRRSLLSGPVEHDASVPYDRLRARHVPIDAPSVTRLRTALRGFFVPRSDELGQSARGFAAVPMRAGPPAFDWAAPHSRL